MDFGIGAFEQRLPDGEEIRTHAAETAGIGERVHELMDLLWETWLRLTAPGIYDVSGNEKVFTALDSSRGRAEDLATHSTQIDTLMRAYADSVDLLKIRAGWVRERIEAFNRDYPESEQDEWDNDDDVVDRRNALALDVGHLHQDLDEAQRDTAARIANITGSGRVYEEFNDWDPEAQARSRPESIIYGYDYDVYAAQLSGHLYTDLPWIWDTYHFIRDIPTGFREAGWEFITSAGTLVGFHGWDNAGLAWKNIGRLGMYAAVVASPDFFTAEQRSRAWDELEALGPALIRYDQWNSNRPGLALGGNIFDIASLLVGGSGIVTAPVKAGTKAGTIAEHLTAAGTKAATLAEHLGKLVPPPGGHSGFGGLTPALPNGHLPVQPQELKLPDNVMFREGKGGGGKTFPDTYSPDSGRDPAIQPTVGDADGGNGYFKDVGRSLHGAPEQQYFSGIDRVDSGHAREYILKDEDGNEVSFDGHGWIGDPPKEYFPEIKGHYDWMWPEKKNEEFTRWARELRSQHDALMNAGTPGYIHEMIFTEKSVMDEFMAFLPPDHPARANLIFTHKPMP